MLGVTALALAPAAAARPPLEDRPEDGSSRSCNAGTLTIRDGRPLKLVVFDQLGAIERPRRYRDNSVLWSSVRKVSCRAFWRRSSGEPDKAWDCTDGYVLRINGSACGLTAGHCSRYPLLPPGGGAWETELAERQDVFLGHRRRQALGSVIANANLGENGPDALVFALDQVPQAAQQIDRGSLTPLRVSGWLPTRRHRNGLVVCFSGRTSGMQRCGRVYERLLEGRRRVVCAHVKTTRGDSGGPVYTRPREGAVKAVGIVMASRIFFGRGDLCYTPIQTVLDAFGTDFPTGVVATSG